MGRGGAVYLCYTAWLLLTCVPSAHAIKGLWKVDIDESPAPSPEDGPPLSAHAIRDRSVLPYEVVGIIAAYLVFVLFMGTAILTFGKRLRKQAQDMISTPQEMVKMVSVKRQKKNKSVDVVTTEIAAPEFDMHAIEAHRRRDQDAQAQLWEQFFKSNESGVEETAQEAEYPEPPPIPMGHNRVASSGSNHTATSGQSGRKPRKTIQNINTARSMQREYGNNADGALEPLSPTHGGYNGPNTAGTYNSNYSVHTPVTGMSWRPGDLSHDGFEHERDMPQPYPQRLPSYSNEDRGQLSGHPAQVGSARTTMDSTYPPRLPRQASIGNINHSLPLRNWNHGNEDVLQSTAPLTPSTVVGFYLPDEARTPAPMTATKQTTLEIRKDDLRPGIRTASGIPYSPYMPSVRIDRFMSPPDLADDLRETKTKQSIRTMMTHEDAVEDDRDMWASGYD